MNLANHPTAGCAPGSTHCAKTRSVTSPLRSRLAALRAAVIASAAAALMLAPASSAAISSAQAIGWLNAQRAANGIPAGITDNPAWDTGCAHHIHWEELNPNAAKPHIETPGTPGYTTDGAFAGGNAVLAGGAEWAWDSTVPWGVGNPWEGAPIHLMQALSPDLQSTGWADDGIDACMVTWAGYTRPAPASPTLVTYPGDGTSWVYSSENAGDWPLVPGDFVGLPSGTITGPYLYVLGYGTGRGSITAASLTGPSGPLAVRTVDNDTATSTQDLGSYLPEGGIIIPVQPLTPQASYTATVTFTPDSGGPALSHTWTFRTAPLLARTGVDGSFDASYGFVSADSTSPAPITVTIIRLPSRTPVRTLTLQPTHNLHVNLPGARYQACFTQPAVAGFAEPAPDCETSQWYGNPGLRLGKARRRGRTVLVTLRASAFATGLQATVYVKTARLCSQCSPATRKVLYRRVIRLAAAQTLKVSARAGNTVEVQTRRGGVGDFLFGPKAAAAVIH